MAVIAAFYLKKNTGKLIPGIIPPMNLKKLESYDKSGKLLINSLVSDRNFYFKLKGKKLNPKTL